MLSLMHMRAVLYIISLGISATRSIFRYPFISDHHFENRAGAPSHKPRLMISPPKDADTLIPLLTEPVDPISVGGAGGSEQPTCIVLLDPDIFVGDIEDKIV